MIRRQVVMPAKPERVWEALTDPDQMAGWFGARVSWELRRGAAARFESDDGHDREGRIDEVRPGRHLRFTWWPAGGPDQASEVSYLLEPVDDGTQTRLTIQERRLSPDTPQASAAAPVAGRWSAWDSRLAGAWGGVAVRSGQGVRA